MGDSVVLTVQRDSTVGRVEADRVRFNPHQFFRFEDDIQELRALERLGQHLQRQPGLAIYGTGRLLQALLDAAPALVQSLRAIIVSEGEADRNALPRGIRLCGPTSLPEDVRVVFLCETRTVRRQQMRRALPTGVGIVEPNVLGEIARDVLPMRAWVPSVKNIYPIDIPEIRFEEGLDVLLLDCPARNLALMPNGLGYVHNALEKTGVRFQTFDLDIVSYHRYHTARLCDENEKVVLPSGREMPVDPWQAEHYDLWEDDAVIDYFMPIIEETAVEIASAKPKILGLSIQACNQILSRKLVHLVREALPEIVIVVGGFSCYSPDIGLRGFPECDYMCVGEADLTVGPLVQALAAGERPRNQPGVLSRFDTPDYKYVPGPMPHDLGKLAFPKYDWFHLDVYRNFNGYQLTPIIASRGCRWSRCTFCAERFYWRVREPQDFVDELEWLVKQGCTLFMFNESDLNGKPERVLEICDEIIRRNLNVKLTGQLRIHKKSDRAFFQKLRKAGFVALRFGVDAFSENTLRLQRKGYTTEMVSQNLKDCWEAGIYTEVNWVIGVPGETERDIDESIELILANREYIGRLANINPLILVTGGVYWLDPESHGIRFRQPREELYEKHPRVLPADLWYSVEPYIDAQVRQDRFKRVILALHDAGFAVGPWALRIIDDVVTARDGARAGGAKSVTQPPVLIRELTAHRLYGHSGKFYAVPSSVEPVDFESRELSTIPGVIEANTEEEALRAIRRASLWANSRGQYDPQDEQRAAGSYLKADSQMGDIESTRMESRTEVLRFGNDYFAVSRSDLLAAVEEAGAAHEGPAARSAPATVATGSHSAPRRLFDLLPHELQARLRLAIRTAGGGGDLADPSSHAEAAHVSKKLRALGRALARPEGRRILLGRFPEARRDVEILPGLDVGILRAVTVGATPTLMRVVGSYNIVEFDGTFYAMPHGISPDWHEDPIDSLPGVLTAERVADLTERLEAIQPRREEPGTSPELPVAEDLERTGPVWLGVLEGHRVLAFEGFFYAIPDSLGEIDPIETDLFGLAGVIRDVSRDVVENEVLSRNRQHATSL